MKKETFAEPLLAWYDANKREMVWRDQGDPYYTWISEIMLQQTRIEAAKEYFVRFTTELPDIDSLAKVSEERLMKLWEGLGYYSRARNLKKAAEILMAEHGGELPADYDKLLKLPGVGPYTAGAIASIAYGIPVPAVDGNVLRVVMRYLQCEDDISKMSVRKRVEQMLVAIMPERPGDFNQAIMELGEVVCIPNGAPLCESCPLAPACRSRAAGCPEEYPKKAEKKPRRIEKRSLFIYQCGEQYGIAKRADKGLLAGLYEFPSEEGHGSKKALENRLKESGVSAKVTAMGAAKHIFSHVEWHMKGFLVELPEDTNLVECRRVLPGESAAEMIFVSREELAHTFTLPVAFHSYLKQILRGEEN